MPVSGNPNKRICPNFKPKKIVGASLFEFLNVPPHPGFVVLSSSGLALELRCDIHTYVVTHNVNLTFLVGGFWDLKFSRRSLTLFGPKKMKLILTAQNIRFSRSPFPFFLTFKRVFVHPARLQPLLKRNV